MRIISEAFPIPSPKRSFQILAFVDRYADHPSFQMGFIIGRITGHQRKTYFLKNILSISGVTQIVQSDPIDHIGILSEN